MRCGSLSITNLDRNNRRTCGRHLQGGRDYETAYVAGFHGEFGKSDSRLERGLETKEDEGGPRCLPALISAG